MAACTSSMLKNWEEMVAQTDSHGKEIDVHQELGALTADIISHTAFSSSYNELMKAKKYSKCRENYKKWRPKLNNLSSSQEASNYSILIFQLYSFACNCKFTRTSTSVFLFSF